MPDHVYRIIEVAGSSEKSIEDAIQNAVGRASRTLRQVGWFEGGGDTRPRRKRQGGALPSQP
jgi:flavin-binding protein dodecin